MPVLRCGLPLYQRRSGSPAERNVTKIYLEVSSKNNNAINFYNKNGFNTESIRKSYYSNGDDALIMWLRDF